MILYCVNVSDQCQYQYIFRFFSFLFKFLQLQPRTYICLNLSKYFYKIHSYEWTFWVKEAIHCKFSFILPNCPPGRWRKFILPPVRHDRSYFFVLLITVFLFFVNLMGEKTIYLFFFSVRKGHSENQYLSYVYWLFVCSSFVNFLFFF